MRSFISMLLIFIFSHGLASQNLDFIDTVMTDKLKIIKKSDFPKCNLHSLLEPIKCSVRVGSDFSVNTYELNENIGNNSLYKSVKIYFETRLYIGDRNDKHHDIDLNLTELPMKNIAEAERLIKILKKSKLNTIKNEMKLINNTIVEYRDEEEIFFFFRMNKSVIVASSLSINYWFPLLMPLL